MQYPRMMKIAQHFEESGIHGWPTLQVFPDGSVYSTGARNAMFSPRLGGLIQRGDSRLPRLVFPPGGGPDHDFFPFQGGTLALWGYGPAWKVCIFVKGDVFPEMLAWSPSMMG